jgi:acetoacetyl-CoA synthetase
MKATSGPSAVISALARSLTRTRLTSLISPPVLWECPPERLSSSSLVRYRRWAERRFDLTLADYNQLWSWSVSELEDFWGSIWEFFGVRASRPFEQVLSDPAMPGVRWFAGAELNFAEHCFRDRGDRDIALVHCSELRGKDEWTWHELRARTAAIAGGLRELGVGPGDRVAAYLPNVPETIAAFLACAAIGAIWSSCSPDFGAPAVLDRFRQIRPRVLLAVDGYRYGGRDFDRRETVSALRRGLPSLERVVLLDYLRPRVQWPDLTDAMSWNDLEALEGGEHLDFAQLPFDHPLWIVYSSGTTGLPKPIVHGHGGILLEHLKLQHLHFDLRPGDRFFWFTTTGWVMWNVTVGSLLTRAAAVLYDGSPAYPDQMRLWTMAEEAGVTCFGASAAFLSASMRAGVTPLIGAPTPIRSIGSTGSPLPAEVFRWVYEHFPPEVWLFSTSGGTDVASALVGGALSVPVYEGEISARMLGVRVESWDESGQPRTEHTGELVVTAPMPSMPLFLWGDSDGERLRQSYFDAYPGVWRHGDWIEITRRGTAIIRGRSDSTINRGGVRIGTSEIYRAVFTLPYVLDAVVLDVPRRNSHGYIKLFVVLSADRDLDDHSIGEIKERIRAHCSPRHLPDEIVQAPGIPRTLSGKIIEVPIKRILTGEPADQVVSRGSLSNPEALDWFISYAADVPKAEARESGPLDEPVGN